MLRSFKLLITILISCLMPSGLYGHFFAFQEWYNPITGQVLEEYYEVHRTENRAINSDQHKEAFLQRAYHNRDRVMVIVEDSASFSFPRANNSTWSAIKDTLRQFDRPNTGTLGFIYNKCVQKSIPAFNIECRAGYDVRTSTIAKEYMDSLANYQDGPLLTHFYSSIPATAKSIVEQYSTRKMHPQDPAISEDFWRKGLTVDALALHTIHTTRDKHFMIAAGGVHFIHINQQLALLGWQLRRTILPTSLNYYEQMNIDTVLMSRSMPTWGDNQQTFRKHEIQIATIESNNLAVIPGFAQPNSALAAANAPLPAQHAAPANPSFLQTYKRPVYATLAIAALGTAWWLYKKIKK